MKALSSIRTEQSSLAKSEYLERLKEFATEYAGPVDGVECINCGECLSVCPVGALTDGTRQEKARTWQHKRVETTCGYCGVGCQLEFNVLNFRELFLCRELVCDGPARSTCNKPKLSLHRKAVDLVHNAIDLVFEFGSCFCRSNSNTRSLA